MTHTDGLKNVETLINRFGGMRPMSRKVDVPVSTIQGWKKRDHIPHERVSEVVRAAKVNHISLDGFEIGTNANENITAAMQNDPVTKPVTAENFSTAPAAAPSAVAPRDNVRTQKKSQQTDFIDARAIKNSAVNRSIITTVSILAIIGGLGYFLFGNEAKQVVELAQNENQQKRQVSELKTKFDSFETTITDGLNGLNSQVNSMANAVGIQRNDQGDYISPSQIPLADMVTNLTGRFENLTQAFDGQGDTEQAYSDMASIVQTLQGRMNSLDIALAQAKADNAELAESMDNVTGRDLSAAAMLLAMTQMRDSLNRAQPFAEDLAVLQKLVGDEDPELTAAINRLAPYAENGILTPQGLSSELKGVSGEIIAAALRGEDVSIQDKMMARLGQIISVQKNGEPVLGIEEQAVVARAQNALERGDVKTALNELNKLEGNAANAASPVTNQLQGSVNANATISAMMQNILKKLQDPVATKNFIQSLPSKIEQQMQGQLYQDDASGIIILE